MATHSIAGRVPLSARALAVVLAAVAAAGVRWRARRLVWQRRGRRLGWAVGRTIGAVYGRLAPASLTIAGLGALVRAAFEAGSLAGWVAAGVALLVLEWRVTR